MESYRATLAGRTPEGEAVRLIVTRQPDHQRGPVWLTFGSTVRSTAALPDVDVDELVGQLRAAQRGGRAGGRPSRAAVQAAAAALLTAGLQQALQAAYDVDASGSPEVIPRRPPGPG